MLSRTMRRAYRCPHVPGGVRCSWWLWRRCRRRHRKVGCVVPDNIDAGVGSYHDRCMARKPKGRQQNQPTRKFKEHHD